MGRPRTVRDAVRVTTSIHIEDYGTALALVRSGKCDSLADAIRTLVHRSAVISRDTGEV